MLGSLITSLADGETLFEGGVLFKIYFLPLKRYSCHYQTCCCILGSLQIDE
jgi:hypothetical protein